VDFCINEHKKVGKMILIYDNELRKYEVIANYNLSYYPNVEIIKTLGVEFNFLNNTRVSEREINTIMEKQKIIITRHEHILNKLKKEYELILKLKSEL